jgi:hypothetical protein
LLLILSGLGAALAGLTGYLVPIVRNAEAILPDFDAMPEEAVAEAVV